jgi:polar amino acid transport system substrate-binding protein
MKRITAVLFALTLVVAACGGEEAAEETTTTPETTACAKESLQLVQPGVLTIATGEPAFPPWVIDDDPTNKQGFEAAVAYAVAEKLGFADAEVAWVRTGFDEAIAPGPKTFDFNLQQYSITAERDEVVDFSVPYYTTNQALVAYADSPVVEAATVADLTGYKLGAQIGTTSLAYIEDVIQPETPAAVYDTNADAKSALDAKQVDGLVFDLPTAFYITAVEIPEASIVGVFEVSADQADNFGFLFADGNPLKACVDQALEELRAEGVLDALAAEWIVTGSDLTTITN